MVRPRDGRGVLLPHRPCRFGIIPTALMLVLVTTVANTPTPVMAQKTTAPTTPMAAPEPAPEMTSPTTAAPVVAPATTPPPVTLAPFAPISAAPVSASPATPAPVTPVPTPPPTPPPAPKEPTASPTLSPTGVPSLSAAPSSFPSSGPTNYPTSSHMPSDAPSTSAAPSDVPSTSPPTLSPTSRPSDSPVFAPSSSPSTNVTMFVKRRCEQYLEVKEPKEFDEVQVGIYQLLMQSYTKNFGYEITEPQIVTECQVLDQDLAGRRGMRKLLRYLSGGGFPGRLFGNNKHRLGGQTRQATKHLLVMTFTMQYESRFGYDIEDYPTKFQNYVNSNLEQVTADMAARFLPVVEAQNVIVFRQEPTPAPTDRKVDLPSASPSTTSMAEPTSMPSNSPTESAYPSGVPTAEVVPTPTPTEKDMVENPKSFVVGLSAGLGGAALLVCLLIWHMRRKNQRKEEERKSRDNPNSNNGGAGRGGSAGNQPQARGPSVMEEGMQVHSQDAMQRGGMMQPGSAHGSGLHSAQQQQYQIYPSLDDNPGASSPQATGTVADSIFSNPSMVSGGGSFSSNPEEYEGGGGVRLEELQDEFDNYKNQDLEFMRSGVEESVYGAEGMMSLAMTRALMEDEEAEIHPFWGGAEDPESIEANGLCETNDWLRKNEHSTLDARNDFFQQILNRMVITVRRGMISPADGTRAIHCCAAMLGLQLEKDLPNNVLLVHGMRKTSDLSLGRSFLVETFKSFGTIEGAAIAPSNRGFGFVRFHSPKAVQKALEQFRVSEIEVQDVSVMIKSLRADAPML